MQDGKKHLPFQEHIDTFLFFPGGKRREKLDSLLDAVHNHVNLITLIGDEGIGKTMLSHMLESEVSETHSVVVFVRPVESFEDVVWLVARQLGAETDGLNRKNAGEFFHRILDRLEELDKSLLLVFDEAEKLYLATLERIRKLLDKENDSSSRLQVLLSGRASLLDNLEQLSVVDFDPISELTVTLDPFNEEETREYLNFSVQHISDYEGREVFSREAAEKIFSLSKGNIRQINIFAEESLRSAGKDTSFLVLLENVKDEPPEQKRVRQTPLPDALLRQKKILACWRGLFIYPASCFLEP